MCGELLIWTEDIVEQWKEDVEDLLNLFTMSTFVEAVSEDSEEDKSIIDRTK